MVQSGTKTLLRDKVVKIIGLLLLIRVGLYLPVPGIELDLLSKGEGSNAFFGFAKNLIGNSFLGIGTLGILPYINASIVIQLITPLFPQLEKLQKEEGEFGRQQLTKYTRYLTFVWALALSIALAFFFIKPLVFDWTTLEGVKIVLALVVGSMISLWFAELITEEGLGNGSSMIIFINIVGGIPNNTRNFESLLSSQDALVITTAVLTNIVFYFFIVLAIIIFQDSYKKIRIISAKQLTSNLVLEKQLSETESFIPLKLNQGGIMPLVFSSTVATLLIYPLQFILSSQSMISPEMGSQLLTLYSIVLNLVLIIFFSCFYVSIVLKPKDMAENLSKMAYSIQGVRQGKATIKYIEKVSNRLAFVSGIFLALLAFFPILTGNFFQFTIFKNLTSLLILIGVIADTTSQIQGYLVSTRYEIKKT